MVSHRAIDERLFSVHLFPVLKFHLNFRNEPRFFKHLYGTGNKDLRSNFPHSIDKIRNTAISIGLSKLKKYDKTSEHATVMLHFALRCYAL